MKTKKLVTYGLFAAIMCISSFIRIPIAFTPVPITLQLAVVYITGALLGASGGAITMIVYILLGIFGLPVFAGMNGGIGYLFGPTGGFVIGFIFCAYVTGILTSIFYKANGSYFIQFASIFVAMTAGTVVLYTIGAFQFSLVTGNSFTNSITLAVLPFVWVDLFKTIVSVIIVRQLLQILEVKRML